MFAFPTTPFGVFAASRGVSWTGNALTTVALPILIYQWTGSATLAAVLAVCEGAPYLLLGLHAGALVDRLNAHHVMIVTSWASALIAASVPAAAALGILTTWHILAVSLLTSALFVFFDAASFGAIPALAGINGIGQATSRLLTISTVIGILVPPLGGILTSAIGAPTVLLLDAISYSLSALMLLGLRWQQPSPNNKTRIGTDIRIGLAFILKTPIIRNLTLLGIGNSLTAGAVTALIVVAAVRSLGMESSGWQLGVLFAAAAIGTLAAARLIGPAQRHLRIGTITLTALALNAVFLLGWALATTLLLGALALLSWQFTNSIINLNGIIVRQTVTPAGLQGRVNTTARMIAWGGTPIGAAIGGILADTIGIRTALIVAGSGVVVALITGITTSLKTSSHLADYPPQHDRRTEPSS